MIRRWWIRRRALRILEHAKTYVWLNDDGVIPTVNAAWILTDCISKVTEDRDY